MTQAIGINGLFAKVLVDHMLSLGKPADAMWAALGLSPDSQLDGVRVPVRRITQALLIGARESGEPLFALHAAQSVRPAHLGHLGYALMSSAHGEDAMVVHERFQALLNNELISHYTVRPDVLEVRHEAAQGELPHDAAFWWFLLGARLSFARWVSGRDLHPIRMELPCPAPERADAFEKFVGAPVHYGSPHALELMPATWLAWFNPSADAWLHDQMQARTAQQLAQLADGGNLTITRTRLAIQDRLQNGLPISLESVAAGVQRRAGDARPLSPRQLQADLAQQGLAFKALVEEVRKELALALIKNSALAFAEVARRTGYAEASSFHRAVRRWTGQTPAQLREDSSPGG